MISGGYHAIAPCVPQGTVLDYQSQAFFRGRACDLGVPRSARGILTWDKAGGGVFNGGTLTVLNVQSRAMPLA